MNTWAVWKIVVILVMSHKVIFLRMENSRFCKYDQSVKTMSYWSNMKAIWKYQYCICNFKKMVNGRIILKFCICKLNLWFLRYLKLIIYFSETRQSKPMPPMGCTPHLKMKLPHLKNTPSPLKSEAPFHEMIPRKNNSHGNRWPHSAVLS